MKHILFFIVLLFYFNGLQSQELSPENFGSLALRLFEKYEAMHLKTNWHKSLYSNYLDVTEGEDTAYSSDRLLEMGMERHYLDQMAIEYVKNNKNTFMVILFPDASENPDQAFEILNRQGAIVYKRPILLNSNGMRYFIQAIYDVHHWDGWLLSYEKVFQRYHKFLSQESTMLVWAVLWEGESMQELLDSKKLIRSFYKAVEVCHSSDRYRETIHNAQNMFNQNTIDFLNQFQPVNEMNFEKVARKVQKYIAENPYFRDLYAIDYQGELASGGIFSCSELDCIFKEGLVSPFRELINTTLKRQGLEFNTDDLIFNPNNHFYHKGLRFLTITHQLQRALVSG